jgi:copper chaperone
MNYRDGNYMAKKSVKIKNISCNHCRNTIEKETGELECVTGAKVDKNSSVLTVEWDESQIKWGKIRELLEEINYPPEDPAI